ncbi:polysaccharide pyruvyl transferase family protein [Rhodopirellula bahusiensis]|uniref:Polysaccharide pyruvyl transferase domain-containing protein n=1 Tax=Rhodopirellula bahusiensis TaxID=2014065 RepID=A0A2G1WCI4_9BACT|nr:polysaccharide pyruvyl transferase family protein [Rhodopirellula bahusiensis]PHQ36752.1 hypothetical protein CEE69_05275 [Rhodopirellula bahusiensis]
MSDRILFVGNGSYQNRGCEAIVRGTLEILRNTNSFRDFEFDSGIYADYETLQAQQKEESDHGVSHFGLRVAKPRFSADWFADQANRRLGTNVAGVHSPLQRRLAKAVVALELGGDNYSLDYGVPGHFLEMDNFIQSKNVPVAIWGASIGPFSDSPDFESQMKRHLSQLTGVFVRESFSADYLKSIGVEANVRQVADPAFLLKPTAPSEQIQELVKDDPIGVNLSPLVAKKFRSSSKMPWEITPADLEVFIGFCVDFLYKLLRETDASIVLVPHVMSKHVGSDDLFLMERILEKVTASDRERITLIPPTLNAAQSKWIIGKCRVFVGARTHSTIASIGSGVPTLSLGYSLKARGLNQDVFDTQDWCIPSADLTIDTLISYCKRLLSNEQDLRTHLRDRVPQIREASMSAGGHLAQLLQREI